MSDYDSAYPTCVDLTYSPASIVWAAHWRGWIRNALAPYLQNEQVYTCPSKQGGWWSNPWNGYQTVSYCYNYRLTEYQLESVVSALPAGVAHEAVLWDSTNQWYDTNPTDLYTTRDISWFLNQDFLDTCPHVLYLDWHVKAVDWRQLNWEQIERLDQTWAMYGQPCTSPWQGAYPSYP